MPQPVVEIELQPILPKVNVIWDENKVSDPNSPLNQQIQAAIQRYFRTFPEKFEKLMAAGKINVSLQNGQIFVSDSI